MESYVIRIYRRAQGAPENIVGIIEFVDVQEMKSFRTVWELMQYLSPSHDDACLSLRQRKYEEEYVRAAQKDQSS